MMHGRPSRFRRIQGLLGLNVNSTRRSKRRTQGDFEELNDEFCSGTPLRLEVPRILPPFTGAHTQAREADCEPAS
jgi:hypothetical protein